MSGDNNFFVALAGAISNADDSFRSSYITNGAGTMYWAFNLMAIQTGWQTQLDHDTYNAVNASTQEGGAGMAAYWNGQYQVDTQQKDAQTTVWETLIQADQTLINNIGDARKGNFALADGLGATMAQCISMENF
jgi:hypothetical protein